jgi:hypothetical protein
MPNLKENQLIFEAYRSINEIYEDRYEFRSTRDGYAIVDHSIRGPNNVLARFDRDEKNEAIARYKSYTKQLSPNEIRAGFDKLRAGVAEAFANHSWDEDIIAQTVEEIKTSGYKPESYLQGSTAWLTPDGKWLNLQGEPHYMVSPTVAERGYGPAMAAGYTRVASDGEVIYAEFFGSLTRTIKRAVTDAAIEHRLGLDNIQYDPNAETWYGKDTSEAIEEAGRGLVANKGEWEEVSGDDIKSNKDVQQDVFDIIKAAYGPIGGHPDFPTVDKVPADNNKADVIDTDEPDDVDAAILSKRTEYGTKITTFASDGGTEAKRAAISKVIDLLNTQGNYVEVSGKLMDILIAKGAPTVDDEDTIRTLLKGKEIMWHGDGVYSRTIGGTPHTKKILGKPNI